MIEINLIAQTKKFKMPTVLGMDLSAVNLKLLAISLIISWLGESYYLDYFASQRSGLDTTLLTLSNELESIREGLKGNESIRDELITYNRQLERLRERSEQVRVIINQRTNPRPLFETISRTLPADMWIDSIEINSERKIKIEGSSDSYSSIGSFVISANQSAFFTNISLVSSATKEVVEGGVNRRVEAFEISGDIATYQER
jgi:hypothetical protein